MGDNAEVRWHGRGGQGVVTASELLAAGALLDGKFFQALPEFGAERSGAPIRAYTRISSSPLDGHYPVASPDIVVVLDSTLLGLPDIAQGLKRGGLLLPRHSGRGRAQARGCGRAQPRCPARAFRRRRNLLMGRAPALVLVTARLWGLRTSRAGR